MSTQEKVSIIPTAFTERGVGKTFSASKVRTEFHLLLNYKDKLCIEVINSRFSRKKAINMNGEPVSIFDKSSVDKLRWNWSYMINGESIEFSVLPNASGTGADLKINGKDYFDYVVGVMDRDYQNPESGLAKLNTSMLFVVPSNPRLNDSQIQPVRISEPDLPYIAPLPTQPLHIVVSKDKETLPHRNPTNLPSSSKYVPFTDDLIDL